MSVVLIGILAVDVRSALSAEFTDLTVDVRTVAITDHDSQHVVNPSESVSVDSSFVDSWELNPGVSCYQSASSSSQVIRGRKTITAILRVDSFSTGSNRCLYNSGDGLSATARLLATADDDVFRTTGDPLSKPTDVQLSLTSAGTFDESRDLSPIIFGGIHFDTMTIWSLGAPAGSLETPLEPISVGAVQSFYEPTAGQDGGDLGIRYQAPVMSGELARGFSLTASYNPFTAFQFPEVPTGGNNAFTLTVGTTEIAGVAGETVDLRQFEPAGVSALSLRGDLAAFVEVAGNDPAPRLAFGLGFAYYGLAPFTLQSLPGIAGDANQDGRVDLTDFGILKEHFGSGAARGEGDFNADGKVDLDDFGILKDNFGKTAFSSEVQSVPEPTTLMLALAAAGLLCAVSPTVCLKCRVGFRLQSPSLGWRDDPACRERAPPIDDVLPRFLRRLMASTTSPTAPARRQERTADGRLEFPFRTG